MTEERLRRRATFDEAALLYDEARPGYPAALFDDLVALSGIPPGGRILEIGPGTGQATLPLARWGYRILAIELGAQLAAVARDNLAAYPGVEVRTGAFEDWSVEAGAFDLALAATMFHWLDPASAYPTIARALRPGGAIALCWSTHVRSEADRGFFDAAQAVYDREAPRMTNMIEGNWSLPRADEVPDRAAEEVTRTGLFGPVAARRYRWDEGYDAAGYLRLLGTYSDHRRLDPAARERLFRGLAELIETRYGGRITKGYLTVLYVARRV
jgi:SAM-dependent methyltransferase